MGEQRNRGSWEERGQGELGGERNRVSWEETEEQGESGGERNRVNLCISCWKLGWKGMLCWDESATVDVLQ